MEVRTKSMEAEYTTFGSGKAYVKRINAKVCSLCVSAQGCFRHSVRLSQTLSLKGKPKSLALSTHSSAHANAQPKEHVPVFPHKDAQYKAFGWCKRSVKGARLWRQLQKSLPLVQGICISQTLSQKGKAKSMMLSTLGLAQANLVSKGQDFLATKSIDTVDTTNGSGKHSVSRTRTFEIITISS